MSRRTTRSLLVAALAALTLASPTLAGEAAIVRVGQSGAELQLSDLSSNGPDVLAAWEEDGIGGAKGGMASSSDGGAGFVEWMAIEGYEQLRIDACPEPLHRVAAGTEVVTDDRRMFLVANTTQRIIEEAGTDYLHPDVTCVGADLVVLAVLVRRFGATRLTVWTFKPDLTDGAAFGFDLGKATSGSTPAITASDGWVHVAWVSGTKLKAKRFKVGSAPGFALSPRPTVVVDTANSQRDPRLSVDGKRMVLAWQRGASVVARVSTDRGSSFGRRRVVLAGDASTAKVALLGSAAINGPTIVVAGAISSEGISVQGLARLSTNGGRSWSTIPGSQGPFGMTFATLDGPASDPTLLVAWDQRRGPNDPQAILAMPIPLP